MFCDSLACIYEVQRVLRLPHTVKENKHYPMLLAIRSLVLYRAGAGLSTHLQKVKSHIGVIGNEAADAGAKAALQNPAACSYDLADIDNSYLSSLPAWPCYVPPTDAAGDPVVPSPDTCFLLSDLTSSVKSFILTAAPQLAAGSVPATPLYIAHQSVLALSLPGPSNHMWHTSRCTFPEIRTILNFRYSQVWTAERARMCNLPYRTGNGPVTDGCCPVCPASAVACTDTVAHVLGGCMHDRLRALFIARHNKALLLVHRAFLAGTNGRNFTLMDATGQADVPEGVSGVRIPQWILPAVPSADLIKMRPDMLIIDGLHTVDAPVAPDHALPGHATDPPFTLPPSALYDLQRTCKVLVVELGYTYESHHDLCLYKKRLQHKTLVAALRAAGWTVTRLGPDDVHILLLGSCASVFSSIQPALLALGVLPPQLTPLLNSLHIHAVHYASKILRLRRRLERLSSPLAVPLLMDPP